MLRVDTVKASAMVPAVGKLAATAVRGLASTQGKNIVTVSWKDNIAVVKIDDPTSSVNTLGEQTFKEFTGVMSEIKSNPNAEAAVIISGKSDCFVAGADIKMLSKCKTVEELTELSKGGQDIYNEIERSKIPIVAAIQGSCLGGGMELALACQYRIVSSSNKTKLGLPEMKLGLLPGAGGTQRLPRLVDLPTALTMLLSGKELNARKAKSVGIADRIVDELGPGVAAGPQRSLEYLEEIAVDAARDLANKKITPKDPNARPLNMKGLMRYFTNDVKFTRDKVLEKATEAMIKQSQGNYPNLFDIVNVVRTGLNEGFEAGLKAEREAFGRLGFTNEAKSLMGIFFGMTALKKNPMGKPNRPVKTIGVLGAGLMGAGIGEVSVSKFNTILKDTQQQGLSRGLNQIYDGINGKVKRKKMTSFERDTIMSSITSTLAYDGFDKADMVIEAVFEDLAVKHKVIKEVEAVTPDHCIFATNTSSLSLAEISKGSLRPDRVVGMHYFSPVPKMPLLEIIRTEKTSDDAVAAAYDVGLKQGKTIIVVKDVAGFYVNRCLGPYISECVSLVQDGVNPIDLDKAMLKYGFPVGPIALADEVGIDVASHVQANVAKDLGVRMAGGKGESPLAKMIAINALGRKSGKGFYMYPKIKSKKKEMNPEVETLIDNYRSGHPALSLTLEDIQMRMVTRFVNEAAYCLQDQIIAGPMEGDMGAVFGIGFPPFRGGPFRLIDQYGSAKFVDLMQRYADTYGAQYKPAQILVDLAKKDGKFYN